MVLVHFGGADGLVQAIASTHGPEQTRDILSLLPVRGHRVFGPMMVLAWFIIPTIGVGGNVGLEGQRVISCKDPREAAKVGIWSEIMLFAMLLLLTLPALAVIANHPELYRATPSQRETAYGLMLNDYLPVGFLGLALAALSASVMSTIDSHMNYGAQTLLNDVYRPIVGKISNTHAMRAGRIFMPLILIGSIAVVYFSSSLIGIAIVVAGLFGAVATVAWAQWWWWRVNLWAWVAANVGGPIIYFSLGFILRHFAWWQNHLAMGESMAQQLGMLKALIAMVMTMIFWVVVMLMTRPEDMEVLKIFYRRAKPMGVWGPIRRAVEQEDGCESANHNKPRCLILAGFATAGLGAAWISLAVLAVSELFVGRNKIALAMALSSIVLALLFKRVFEWRMKRLI
jgi:Na+/proline symporter